VLERRQDRIVTRASAAGAKTVSVRLDNGVWVLVLETPKPAAGYRGVASIQLWISAGAAVERGPEHGCAHLLEHMVFKPFADARGRSRDLAGVIEQLGGDVNAFTSHDETVFHATVPADAFAEVSEMMLAAVIGRRIDRELLVREQEVVVEEIRQYADDPSARSMQQMMSDLYGEHAYARPVLGEEDEVRSLTPGILQGFGRRQHRGERITLVVAGPVSSKKVEALARRVLGPLAGARRTVPRGRPKPPTAPCVRVLREDVQETYLRFGWMGGTVLEHDGVALDVAAVALGQGESSRLAVGVRRRARLVSDAYASYLAGVISGTFMVSAQADAELTEQAAVALLAEVEALGQRTLEHEELDRARAMLQSSLIYRRETVQGQAHAIGYFATTCGRLDAESEYFEILAQLTPERVREACAEHLRRDRVAMTIMVPRDRVDARTARAIAKRLERGQPSSASAAVEPAAPIAIRASQPAGQPAGARSKTTTKPRGRARSADPRLEPDELGICRVTHASGLRIVARPDASVPMVSAWLVWPGGLRLESTRDAGLASLTAAVLNRGTTRYDGDALAREIEGLAAVLDGFCGHNSLGLQTECLAEHLPTVLSRAFECALDPSFSELEIEEARRIAIADLDADADDPGHVAYREMLATLYGQHPHGRDLRGTADSLVRFDRAKLVRHWRRQYPIGRAVLSLAGALDLPALLDQLDELLASAHTTERPDPMPGWPGGPPKWPKRALERKLMAEREQGHCVIGFPGLHVGADEGAALDVLCSVLGGQAGRLFEVLREREGLVYQVGASASEHIDGGHVVFYAASSQDKLDSARAAIEAEIVRIVREPITSEELVRAQQCLIGQFESGLQRRSRVASRMVFGEAYGLGAAYFLRYPERIATVEREQILALAKRLLDPRRQVTVTVRSKGRSKSKKAPRSGK
jgi:zinc protease